MNNKWKTTWTASPQGPYPVGNVAVQTELDPVFPNASRGAVDQAFRLTLRPDLWGERVRVRFSNRWGTRPLAIERAHAGLLHSGAALTAGTTVPLLFSGRDRAVVPAGGELWSDGADLAFFAELGNRHLAGRKLAVSFRVCGESGPMTWHATAANTSYVSAPGAAADPAVEDEFAFPFPVNSWFFLDAVDMAVPAETQVIACFGDSITDGSNCTPNGEDRWPDIFSRLLHSRLGNGVAVINAGIGGNQIAGPRGYTTANPFHGGPAAAERAAHDILSLTGVGTVVWLEGINDFHVPERTADEVAQAMRETVAMWREASPGIRVVSCTVPSALGSSVDGYGGKEQDMKRRKLNEFIRTADCFDAWIDFDRALTDPVTGEMGALFVPNCTRGGEGDKLHPNRVGKLRMVEAIDADSFLWKPFSSCLSSNVTPLVDASSPG